MERDGDEVHLSEDEARSGSTPHIVRYVLAISTLLVVIALSAIWITGALTSPADTGGIEDTKSAAEEMKE